MASIISASTTSGTALNMSADTTGVLQLATGATPTTAVTIDTSQNVGIGTASPTRQFVINSSFPVIQLTNPTSGTTSNDGFLIYQSGLNASFSNQESGYLSFETANTERMRIDSNGNLCVGTTSPYTTSLLTVISANANNARITTNFYNSAATTTTRAGNNIARIASNGNGADVSINFTDNVANNYYIGGNNAGMYCFANTNGVRLSNGGTSWASDSDERLKDIIEPIENAIEKVSTLRTVIGKYKTDEEGTRRSFLIAQDVQAVLPEAVVAQDDEIKTLSLAYTDVIPLLVAAIKEQQTIINDLKARVTALEAK